MHALRKLLGIVLVIALEPAALARESDVGDEFRSCVAEDALAQVCYLRCSGTQTLNGNLTIKGNLTVQSTKTFCIGGDCFSISAGKLTYNAAQDINFGATQLSSSATAGFTGGGAGTFSSSTASGNNGFQCTTNGCRFDFGAGASDYASSDGTTVTIAGPIAASGVWSKTVWSNTGGGATFASGTAPTISSGFGTSPSVASNNGTFAFTINVGTGGTATSGVIGMPSATNGWVCYCADLTTNSATVFVTKQTASSTTSCTVGNFNTAGAAAAWVASDILHCIAMGR